ncbi:MAG: PT domain-containing protein [Planctomycetota bacterium]
MRFMYASTIALMLGGEPPTSQPDAVPSSQPTTAPTSQPEDPNPAAPGFDAEHSDPRAIELADEVMTALGGRSAWDSTRYIAWDFVGARTLLWDKQEHRVRIDMGDNAGASVVVVVDLATGDGRAWKNGSPMADEDGTTLVRRGIDIWRNDSYWLVMPYKLKDDGVTLTYVGEDMTADQKQADVIALTYTGVGTTPDNKYHVYINRETKLVDQWDFYVNADDAEPQLSTPWAGWKRHGDIMLCGDRGRMQLSDIGVYDTVPETAFTNPMKVMLTR